MQQTDVRDAALRRLHAQLAERAARKQVPQPFVIPDAQATAVNAATAQLNLPWRDLLDAIEAATPAHIALLALEPDAKKSSLRGTAEAKSHDTMIAYIEELKKQGFLGLVALSRHETNEQDQNKPLRFQFEAQWTGATP